MARGVGWPDFVRESVLDRRCSRRKRPLTKREGARRRRQRMKISEDERSIVLFLTAFLISFIITGNRMEGPIISLCSHEIEAT